MTTLKKTLPYVYLTIGLSMICLFSAAQKTPSPASDHPDWVKPYEPFRIVGNLYYVGTYDLACYLITTPEGHILINTGIAESVTSIHTSMEKLGFNFSDIKILLATHAHNDHVGALAGIKKLTGAKVLMNENDAPVLSDGGIIDYLMGCNGFLFDPVKPDGLLHDNDTVNMGGMKVVALHHPGHTKGATSFLFDIKDNNRSYRVLIANMPTILEGVKLPSMPTYPTIGKDLAYTLDALKKLQFDIFLSSHASQFGLHKKRKEGDAYNPEIFIDRAGYDSAVDSYKKTYLEKLKAAQN